MSKVMNCNCLSEFQDRMYGKNQRLFNAMGKDGKDGWRCTICGREVKEGSSKK